MDYNIYIRDKTGGQSKPTQPRQSGSINTKPKQTSTSSGFGSNQQNAIGEMAATAAAAFTWVGKIAMAIYAGAKVADSVVSTIESFVTRETGDYRFSIGHRNLKQTINNFMNPVSYVLNQITYYQQTMLINKKQEQERLLIGDSFVNSVSRKV